MENFYIENIYRNKFSKFTFGYYVLILELDNIEKRLGF